MKREIKSKTSVDQILDYLDAAILRHPSSQGKVVESEIGDETTNPTTLNNLGEN